MKTSTPSPAPRIWTGFRRAATDAVQLGLASCVLPALIGAGSLATANASAAATVCNVLDFGAKGDGTTLDTAAIQKAIDAAAKERGVVLIPRHHTFLISTLELKSGIDFRLAGTLLISTNRSDYSGDGVIMATDASNLRITGKGKILGQSLAFMRRYDAKNEWWLFKSWRPKMFVLTGCTNLVVRDISFGDAPFWGLHMLGCEHVVVDHLTVNNRLDVPNDDGIDPDHCRDVVIKNCHLTCGDDGIVIKATRQTKNFGSCANIRVQDCVIRTQDAGLKIGTETTRDIHNILFEHCRIISSSRGLCIQLRDEGTISNICFRDIRLVSRYHSAPWWGRGEAISFTAIPRTAATHLGKLCDVTVENVTGRAENSIRVDGSPQSPIENVRFKNVSMKFARWTKYPGGVYDNRPTKVLKPVEPHATDGFNFQFVDGITLEHCSVGWQNGKRTDFGDAIGAAHTHDLTVGGLTGDSPAHPIRIR